MEYLDLYICSLKYNKGLWIECFGTKYTGCKPASYIHIDTANFLAFSSFLFYSFAYQHSFNVSFSLSPPFSVSLPHSPSRLCNVIVSILLPPPSCFPYPSLSCSASSCLSYTLRLVTPFLALPAVSLPSFCFSPSPFYRRKIIYLWFTYSYKFSS